METIFSFIIFNLPGNHFFLYSFQFAKYVLDSTILFIIIKKQNLKKE